MKRMTLFLLIFAFLLAACQPAAPRTQVAAQTAPAPTLAPSPTPTPALPALMLNPCSILNGVRAECGTLRVKEDRTSADSRVLQISTIIVRAQDKNAAQPDPLFFLAGGPGGIATEAKVNVLNIFLQINKTHDVVFIDQRGADEPHKIACTAPSFSFADASQEQVDAFAKKCISEVGSDLRFYTTAAYAQDLDEARPLLGYDKINLYGISYGVTSAQVYMRLFGDHVRSAVLDHGSFLDLPMFEVWAHSSQLALDKVFARCEKDSACRAAFPNLQKDWQAILDRLDKGPVTLDMTQPGTDEKIKVTTVDLNGIHSLLFDTKKAAMLPQVIHLLATTEDWTPIVKSLQENSSTGDNQLGLLYYTTVCNEGWAGYDEQEVARLSAGSYLLDWNLRDARGTMKMCRALPKADPSVLYGVGKPAQTPVLILSGETDPQNPPENMAQAAGFWPNSRQVIEPGMGHTTPVTNCRWDIVTLFINQGTAQGIDTSCITNASTESFVIGK